MKRGEIWTVAGGADYAGKPRPALVLQNDAYSDTNSVTICMLTSELTLVRWGRATIEPGEANGLTSISQAMTDKISTVPRSKIGKRIGVLSDAEMAEVDRAIMVFLGLAG